MPPAASSKPSRVSIYGWNRRRSPSPPVEVPVAPAPAPLPVAAAPPPVPSKHKMPAATQPSSSFASSSSSSSLVVPSQPLPHQFGSVPGPVVRKPEDSPYRETDYEEEIMQYMYTMDYQTTASADLMDMQPELQWFMRPYLIDFLIEVHSQFRLRPEVLYLAMNIVDRYVSKRVVYKKHYQLVGCAALWIAAKFEDAKDKVPLVKELAEMCCKAYDESAFIQMEGHVLSTIGWVIGHPSAEAWLRMYSDNGQEEPKVSQMARFLMEVTLFHREFVGIQSSVIAGAALTLARYMCGKQRRVFRLSYDNEVVKTVMMIDKQFGDMLDQVSEIIIRKYAPAYYCKASTVVREWYLSGRRFVYQSEAPATPISAGVLTPGLAPSGSWSAKHGSWISSSPSGGSISCSSSEAGDDAPVTPITPMYMQHVDPFSASAKENIAPTHVHAVPPHLRTAHPSKYIAQQQKAHVHAQHGKIPPQPQWNTTTANSKHAAQQAHMGLYVRPALHAIPAVGELAIPNRGGNSMRRSSN